MFLFQSAGQFRVGILRQVLVNQVLTIADGRFLHGAGPVFQVEGRGGEGAVNLLAGLFGKAAGHIFQREGIEEAVCLALAQGQGQVVLIDVCSERRAARCHKKGGCQGKVLFHIISHCLIREYLRGVRVCLR